MTDRKKTLADLVERLSQCPKSWDYRVALTLHTPVVGKELVLYIPVYGDDSAFYHFKSVGVVTKVNAVWLAGGWHFFAETVNGDLYIVQRSGFSHRSSRHNTFIGAVACTVIAPNTSFEAESPVYTYAHVSDTIYTAQLANITILETVFIPNTNLMVIQVKLKKISRIFNIICTTC